MSKKYKVALSKSGIKYKQSRKKVGWEMEKSLEQAIKMWQDNWSCVSLRHANPQKSWLNLLAKNFKAKKKKMQKWK